MGCPPLRLPGPAVKPEKSLRARVRGFRPPRSLWKDAALQAFEELNTPRSLTCSILLRAGEFLQLAELRVNPHDYDEYCKFSKDYQATELLRKFSGLPGTSTTSRREAAREKAVAAERQCEETNRRISQHQYGASELFPNAEATLHRARRKIAFVLGEYSLDRHLSAVRWGPGADVLNKRPYISSYHKFKSALCGPRSCVPYLSALLESNNLWATWLSGHEVDGPVSPIIQQRNSNRYTTVPKTALTDRSICIEPGAAIYLQLGLGQCIRRRLRRVGIDLDSQEKNRMLALEGSYDSSWATIDLSSASDTVARRLVQLLFMDPSFPDLAVWYRVMDDLRCKFTEGLSDSPWLNQKFSSMGNGYTFELETLVFWALSSAAAEEIGEVCAAVYGDDIIVSNHAFDRVREVLEGCGFSVNTKKSFSSSYFRESCGMNAWDGYEVVSYRLEELRDLTGMYSFHNGLRRCGLPKAANTVLKCIPNELRFFGPALERSDSQWVPLGDIVLEHPDVHRWSGNPYGVADQWFFWGYRVRCLKFTPKKVSVRDYEPALLHSFATMVPLGDHPIYDGMRWGTQGFATLANGVWNVGEALTSLRK
nr:MAG: RNA replicase beta chain [Sanya fiers-like virus 51]